MRELHLFGRDRKLEVRSTGCRGMSCGLADCCVRLVGSRNEPDRGRESRAGFTLLEVLVSMVLISSSMLGLAALQNSGTRIDAQAYLRTQGVVRINDMVDRMRANLGGVKKGHYSAKPIPESFDKDCGSTEVSCNRKELAVYDLVSWNIGNGSELPGGNGKVSPYGSPMDNSYRIRVQWFEQKRRDNSASAYLNPCDGSSNYLLHCVQLVVRL